jgi:energy-coupling factor transport system permease protein
VAPIAVAGSVAWSFLPSAAQAFNEIRESQAARGHRIRGLRDLPPLVVPLLGGGLERAITMSEALESRGFGHSGATVVSSSASRWLLVGAIGSGLLMAYAFAVGQTTMALFALALAIGLALVSMRISPAQGRRTTRYRASSWARPDWFVASASLMALLIFFWRNWAVSDAAVFNPYPRLSWPVTDLWMLLGLALLIVPALIVPTAGEVV